MWTRRMRCASRSNLALIEPFTTSDLAAALAKPRILAQEMAYCLRKMGAITPVGKRRNAILYSRSAA